MVVSHHTLSCVQWNARGLTKSRLEEFKNYLSLHNPNIILLSETHWKPTFNITFHAYNCTKLDRFEQRGGGVAIFSHKFLAIAPLDITPAVVAFEAVRVSVRSLEYGLIDVISVYCPTGSCSVQEVSLLFDRPGRPCIIGGDSNGHCHMWESNSRPNRCGRSTTSALEQLPDITLVTPKDLATRVCPGSGRSSTLDLIFA